MPPVEATASPRPEGSEPDVSFAMCLPRTPAATGDARHVIRRRLGELLSEDALDDVLLVVTELVANAVVHGRGDVTVELACEGRCVAGLVADEGLGFEPVAPAGGRVGHYGLEIVERVAQSWGVRAGASSIWFTLPEHRPRGKPRNMGEAAI